MKWSLGWLLSSPTVGRSREGAWIEIRAIYGTLRGIFIVAPVRERGLKCAGAYGKKTPFGRSREGAWIEIQSTRIVICSVGGRSRKGAWIEINGVLDYILKSEVAPVRERGLKF